MQNTKGNIITEKEIDQLLNNAFLELDFENVNNGRLLEVVANHNLKNGGILRLFKSNRFYFLLLVLCMSLCFGSYYAFITIKETADVRLAVSPKIVSKLASAHLHVKEKKEFYLNEVYDKREITAVHSNKKIIHPSPAKNFKTKTIHLSLPVVAVETDTILPGDTSITKIKPTENLVAPQTSDSVRALTSQVLTPETTAPVTPTKPVTKRIAKKTKTEIVSTKGKKVRKGRKTLFQRNGTFIMKSGKYRKSSRV